MYAGRSYQNAIDLAKANARWFGRPYYAFAYLGGWCVERDRPKRTESTEVFPDGTTKEKESD